MTDEELHARFDRIESMLLQLMEQRGKSKLSPEDKAILLGIWEASPRQSRQRSSKKRVAEAWQKVPRSARPTLGEALVAMKAWKRCDEWLRDGGQYIPALHRLVAAHFWDSPPEPEKIVGMGFAARKKEAPSETEDGMSGPEAAQFLEGLQ